MTTTTHKTLRGPRGGLILSKAVHAAAVDKTIFPGTQGGPLMHVIAAKAVCFGECLQPEFKVYSAQIIANARRPGRGAWRPGLPDRLRRHRQPPFPRRPPRQPAGADGQEGPGDPRPRQHHLQQEHRALRNPEPFQASGIRLGTPAVTTRGLVEADMEEIAGCIDTVLKAIGTPGEGEALAATKTRVTALTGRFPLPYTL